jgi:hypothetical protein
MQSYQLFVNRSRVTPNEILLNVIATIDIVNPDAP